MVHTIAANKNKNAEKAKAHSACPTVNSLDSIRLESDCGFVREKLTKPVDNFLSVAFYCLLRVQDSLEE